MKNLYDEEYKTGFSNEVKIKSLIEKDLSNKLNITDRYCSYDFCNDDTIVEFKNRRTKSNSYATTILTLIKANKMMDIKKKRYLYINFLDGLFKCTLDENLLNNSRKGITKRYDRGPTEVRQCYYIPMKYFTSVN